MIKITDHLRQSTSIKKIALVVKLQMEILDVAITLFWSIVVYANYFTTAGVYSAKKNTGVNEATGNCNSIIFFHGKQIS